MFNNKDKIIELGLNYKKENIKTIAANIILLGIAALAFYFLRLKIIFAIGIFLLIVLNFYISYMYDKKLANFRRKNEVNFVIVLNYVKTYLTVNYNVYKALEETIQYVDKYMQDQIGLLLCQIDNDKTIVPFIEFAKKFHSRIIEQVMISLYLMVDNGTEKEYITRFGPIFNQLEKENETKIVKNVEDSYNSLNLMPVIGAAIITLIIVTGILGMMGDVLSGF